MFVQKDKDGNLVGVGSIDHNRLAQLQAAAKRKSAKADSKAESQDELPAEPKVEKAAEPKAAEPKPVEKEAAPDEPKTTKSSATPKLP